MSYVSCTCGDPNPGFACVAKEHDLGAQLAAALKERDAAQAALKAAETLLELAASTHAGVVKERDEARAERDKAIALLAEVAVDRKNLRAALEPTAENVNDYANALAKQYVQVAPGLAVRFVLAAIRTRAGLEVKPLSCQHGRPGGHLCPHCASPAGLEQLDRVPGDHGQGHEQAGEEHAVADGLGLAVRGDGVDDQAHDADDERDEGDHPQSVGPGPGGGKEG